MSFIYDINDIFIIKIALFKSQNINFFLSSCINISKSQKLYKIQDLSHTLYKYMFS